MTERIYILPQLHVDLLNGRSYNIPAYVPHRYGTTLAGLEGVAWSCAPYLLEDVCLIVADVNSTQHLILTAQIGVIAIPVDLDTAIANSSVRNRIRDALESARVPGTWVVVGMTYRQVLRVVLGMFQLHGRLVGRRGQRVFDGSVNLEMTVGQLPESVRNHLRDAASDFGLDYSAVTSATTLRQALRGAGEQFASHVFAIGGLAI